jgi:hypothetical protein
MTDTTQDIKKWIAAWRKASSALTEQKKKDLRDPGYYEKNLRILDEMLDLSCARADERLTSGLVEQQRWFMKLREKEAAVK